MVSELCFHPLVPETKEHEMMAPSANSAYTIVCFGINTNVRS
jgi:hypothetical protein